MSSTLYAEITQKIVEQLESGHLPWIKPWRVDMTADKNIVSQKAYQGINRLLLGVSAMCQGYSNPAWGTYKQWEEMGANVKKGEKATHIVFFKPVTKENKETGDKEAYAVLKSYCVFNAEQVEGIEVVKPVAPEGPAFIDHARAESTLVKSGAAITHGGDAAFFAPGPDIIKLPIKTSFNTESDYYATAFHELTHWTGHKNRLDRDLSKGRFGNPAYAFEELVAEMGAAFLCADHKIEGKLQHAAYIQSWIKALKDNDKAIFKAAALAQKASDYILALDATKEELAA